jgi:hypothetical protein
MTVQQHAARAVGVRSGALSWWVAAGQQHSDRIVPSYTHWYRAAVAIDGASTNASKNTTTQRTA